MGKWSVTPQSAATFDEGKLKISENTSSEDRKITVTYDDQSGNTASTVIIQMGRVNMDDYGAYAVDLGLPSGNLWGKMNIGASGEFNAGPYYQYGKGKRTFQETSGETAYDGNENPLAGSADTACMEWTNRWHIPTKEDFEELIANTTQTWGIPTGGTLMGAIFSNPTNNNNYVFFPANGFINGGSPEWTTNAIFWTSTIDLGNENKHPFIVEMTKKDENKVNIGIYNHDSIGRTYGLSVRGVIKDYSRMKY